MVPAGGGEGDAAAVASVGDLYFHGRGVGRDYGEAATWFQQAAERGHVSGTANLGHMMYKGVGGARDKEEGRRLIEKSAEMGSAWAKGHRERGGGRGDCACGSGT